MRAQPRPQHRSRRRRAPARAGTTAVVLGAALVAGALTAAAPPAQAATVAVPNSGFESGLTGWTVSGTTSAAKTESGGHNSSATRLTHYSASAYSVTTGQRVTGLSSGWWTASAWVKSNGLDASRLVLSGCGSADASITLPSTEQDDLWVRVSVSAQVTAGACTLALVTNGGAGAWASMDDVELVSGQVVRGVRGGDLSSLAKNEAKGARYRDENGTLGDPVTLLASRGMNLARLKVWVNPGDGYNTTPYVVETARRAKAAGMQVMIDFHYSDTWADPGKQYTPAAWAGHTPAQLTEDVRAHTTSVMQALRGAGISPEYVQIGNEINPGMLWPYGQTWDVDTSDGVTGAQWGNLASFLTAGSQAVKAVSPSSKVILHLTNINTGVSGLTWWFDEITARNVPFDVIGLSYYGYWHGSLAALQEAITALSARYNRDVMVVETSYPFTLSDDSPGFGNVIDTSDELVAGYPATPAGQASWVRAVMNAVAAAPGGRGIGTVYWEPAWTAVAGSGWDPDDPSSGNAWENQAIFDFNDRLLPAAREFAPDPGTTPPPPTTTTTTRPTTTTTTTTTRPTTTTTTTRPTTTTTTRPTTTTTTTRPTTTTTTTTTTRPTTTTTTTRPTTTTTAAGGRTCTAQYTVAGQWPGGFQGAVTVTAGSSAISSWQVTWTFASGQAVTQAWGADVTSSGSAVTASNAAWNGSLGAGGSTTFGFIGSFSGSNPVPAVSCTAG